MKEVTFEDIFDGLQILPSRDETEVKFIDILNKQKELMEFALANHSKIMQVRFDLHYPSDGSILFSPEHISDFSYNLSNAIKNKFTVFDIANKLWKNTLKINEEGLVHYCLSKRRKPEYDNGIVIDKNKEDFSTKRDVAFRSGSYLAKTFSKDGLDRHAWRYGYSRLPRC